LRRRRARNERAEFDRNRPVWAIIEKLH
jgi:hypothetical protein